MLALGGEIHYCLVMDNTLPTWLVDFTEILNKVILQDQVYSLLFINCDKFLIRMQASFSFLFSHFLFIEIDVVKVYTGNI